MRIAITGAGGRLGMALVRRLRAGDAAVDAVLSWDRDAFDLDHPNVGERLDADRPDLVIHAAAWTDVDGCARDPGLAMSRNGEATRVLAEACASRGISMIVVSTNEVFDGERTDGIGYAATEPTRPANAYGRSKLAGETAARRGFADHGRDGAQLGVVRTAWLFGRGKPDFPAKIAAAAAQAISERRPLRVVGDEVGCPTYVVDVADAIARLIAAEFEGVHHVVNAGVASRAEWARDVLRRLDLAAEIEEVALRDYPRPSSPPHWGVLAPTPLPGGPLRDWRDAMADRMPTAPVA